MPLFNRRKRFQIALQEVISQKRCAFSADQKFDGVALSDHVFNKVNPPFFANLVKWILAHWQQILSVIMLFI
jgi:hypothetical protein